MKIVSHTRARVTRAWLCYMPAKGRVSRTPARLGYRALMYVNAVQGRKLA